MNKRMVWTRRALADFDRLDRPVRQQIIEALERFAETGYGDIQPLKGTDGESRLRVGRWRVRLIEDNAENVIHIQRVLHRSEAYRR